MPAVLLHMTRSYPPGLPKRSSSSLRPPRAATSRTVLSAISANSPATSSVCFAGSDPSSDSALPPSVVVAELLDYLQRACITEGGEPVLLQVEHPLQPFSPRCFDGSTVPASYAEEWYPGGEADREPVFVPGPLPDAGDAEEAVDLRQLKRFWAHPVRFFLQERLGLRLLTEDEPLPERVGRPGRLVVEEDVAQGGPDTHAPGQGMGDGARGGLGVDEEQPSGAHQLQHPAHRRAFRPGPYVVGPGTKGL
mgnify:CR=1 FL=1